jgi:hypothetical protein
MVLIPLHLIDRLYADFFLLAGGGLYHEFFSGRVQQIQLRIEGRENGDVGAEVS